MSFPLTVTFIMYVEPSLHSGSEFCVVMEAKKKLMEKCLVVELVSTKQDSGSFLLNACRYYGHRHGGTDSGHAALPGLPGQY